MAALQLEIWAPQQTSRPARRRPPSHLQPRGATVSSASVLPKPERKQAKRTHLERGKKKNKRGCDLIFFRGFKVKPTFSPPTTRVHVRPRARRAPHGIKSATHTQRKKLTLYPSLVRPCLSPPKHAAPRLRRRRAARGRQHDAHGDRLRGDAPPHHGLGQLLVALCCAKGREWRRACKQKRSLFFLSSPPNPHSHCETRSSRWPARRPWPGRLW